MAWKKPVYYVIQIVGGMVEYLSCDANDEWLRDMEQAREFAMESDATGWIRDNITDPVGVNVLRHTPMNREERLQLLRQKYHTMHGHIWQEERERTDHISRQWPQLDALWEQMIRVARGED